MAAWCLSREWALFIIERIRAGSCLSLLASDWSQLWLSWPLIGQHSSGYNKCRLHHLRILVSPVSARISASEDLSALSSLSEAGLSSAHSSLQPPQQPPSLSCLPGITPQSASSVTTHLEDIIKIVNTQWLPPREVLYPDGRCHLIASLHSLLSFPPFPWSQWLTLLSSLSS